MSVHISAQTLSKARARYRIAGDAAAIEQMPGPYHIALARPITKQWKENDEDYYFQEQIVALSENYQDVHDNALWRFWRVTGATL